MINLKNAIKSLIFILNYNEKLEILTSNLFFVLRIIDSNTGNEYDPMILIYIFNCLICEL
jgi:hypothetical protein